MVFLSIAAGLLSFVIGISAVSPAKCGRPPEALIAHLRSSLPGYDTVPIAAFDSAWPAERPPTDAADGGPNCLTGDFDGNGLVDYVMFIRKGYVVELMAFHQMRSGGYRNYRVWTRDSFTYRAPLQMAIFRVPPGTLYGGGFVDAPEEKVLTKTPSVDLVFFETSSVTLYWRNGAYHPLWTSD